MPSAAARLGRAMTERERYEAIMIAAMTAPFGSLYGASFYATERGVVGLFRKGQRVRFYTMRAERIGPEQSNVAPAICAAAASGWCALEDTLRH